MALVLAATPMLAEGATKYLVVSKGLNCYPGAGAPYTTIQAAVNAMPNGPTGVNTVVVCPGIYAEQLKINKNITITGVLRDGNDPPEIDGNSNEARIVPPPGGLVLDPDFLGNVAAQVTAQNVTDINLVNLSIDGTGIGCPIGLAGPVPTAGIALYNVGITGSNYKATISRTVVHNQIGYCADANGVPVRSYTGEGIRAEKSWFTLDSNSLSNVDLSLVHQIGGISKILNNWLNYGWQGILLTNATDTYGANIGSTISSNTVTTFSTGIYLDGTRDALVSANTLAGWNGAAIALINLSWNNDVLSNKIIDANYGVYLSGGAGNVVKSNTIIRPTNAGIVEAYSHGGNVFTGNTINQSPIGIFVLDPIPSDDVVNPNVYYNTTVLTKIGSVIP